VAERNVSWHSVVETLGILGLIGSLLFVATEIRQNTAAISSATIQGISDQAYESSIFVAENAAMRDALRAMCDGSETIDQRLIMNAFIDAVLRIQLNRFYQSKLNVLDRQTLLELGGRGAIYTHPAFAEIWEQSKSQYAPEFQDYVEQQLLPLVQPSCSAFLVGAHN